jgi:hypothetical protein
MFGKITLVIMVAGAFTAVPVYASGSGPQTSTTASIALTPGDPSLSESVTFVTTYPKATKSPAVEINCYQNSVLVWGQVGLVTDSYKLGGDSSPWLTNGGTATCFSNLDSITFKAGVETKTVLATMSFTTT